MVKLQLEAAPARPQRCKLVWPEATLHQSATAPSGWWVVMRARGPVQVVNCSGGAPDTVWPPPRGSRPWTLLQVLESNLPRNKAAPGLRVWSDGHRCGRCRSRPMMRFCWTSRRILNLDIQITRIICQIPAVGTAAPWSVHWYFIFRQAGHGAARANVLAKERRVN